MRRALLSLLIGTALLAGIPAQAFWQSRDSNYNLSIGGAPPPSYTGPGDVVSGATFFYSCTRGYNAAYATGSNKACNIRRASDNATQDINILSNGLFDVASFNSFVGTDATCTGSMVGTTTLTISSCASGTLHVNDTISGAGITQPAYITAIGSCASPPGTCTVNMAQTFASETVTAQVAGFVTKAYDQTAGNACAGGTSCDVLNATAAQQPELLPVCINSLPCMASPTSSFVLTSANTFTPNAAHQLTLSLVANQLGTTTGSFFFEQNGAQNYIKHQSGVANKWQLGVAAGNTPTVTANDNIWHAANAVEQAGTNATVMNLDGVETTTTATPNSTAGAPLFAFGSAGPNFFAEAGSWDNLVFTSGNRTSMCKNQQAIYGSGNFGAAC